MTSMEELTIRIEALEAQRATVVLAGRNNYTGPMQHDEPLDSPVILTRKVDIDPGRYYLTNTLAIIQEEHGEWSCPAPLFVEVQATDHPRANVGRLTSMATAIYTKAVNRGKVWLAAFHSDLWHHGPGSSIGVNIECKVQDEGGEVFGFNAEADMENSIRPADYGFRAGGPFRAAFYRHLPGVFARVGDLDLITVRADGAIIWGSHKDPKTGELIGSFATDAAGNLYAGEMMAPGVRRFMIVNGRVWLDGKRTS